MNAERPKPHVAMAGSAAAPPPAGCKHFVVCPEGSDLLLVLGLFPGSSSTLFNLIPVPPLMAGGPAWCR